MAEKGEADTLDAAAGSTAMNQGGDSIMEVHPLFPAEGGGSIPTSPLHPKNFRIRLCREIEVRGFIETHHYSHNMNGVMSDCCFSLTFEGEIWGAAVFASTATDAWKKFSDTQSDVLELRRFCLVDAAPKNSESFFLGYCIRFLRKHSKAKVLITYADASQGHSGIIYKATGFKYEGAMKTPGRWLMDGKTFHDKTVRTTYKGKLKPFAAKLAKAVSDGSAIKTDGVIKHCFRLDL